MVRPSSSQRNPNTSRFRKLEYPYSPVTPQPLPVLVWRPPPDSHTSTLGEARWPPAPLKAPPRHTCPSRAANTFLLKAPNSSAPPIPPSTSPSPSSSALAAPPPHSTTTNLSPPASLATAPTSPAKISNPATAPIPTTSLASSASPASTLSKSSKLPPSGTPSSFKVPLPISVTRFASK